MVLTAIDFMTDPQSLHKYLYAHANPVTFVDPSGKWSIVSVGISMAIGAIVNSMATVSINIYTGATWTDNVVQSAIVGAFAGVVGGAVAAKLATKTIGVALRSALAGLSAGMTGQIITEIVNYAYKGEEFTFSHACGSTVRVVTAGFGGFVTGGLLSRFNITTTSRVQNPRFTAVSTYQTTVNVGSASAVGGGNYMESFLRGAIGFDEWVCGGL